MPKLADDILRKWHQAAKYYWDETSSQCTHPKCGTKFTTGDVCFLFGDLETAAAKKDYLCARCGMAAVYHEGKFPSATTLFIENRHRNKKLSKLPEDVRELVIEGFAIIDQIHSGVEARLAQILDEKASKEQPS